MNLFNLVRVTLTKRGAHIWEHRVACPTGANCVHLEGAKIVRPLWMIMQVFGDSVHPDLEPVFTSMENLSDTESLNAEIMNIAESLHLDIGIKNASWKPALVRFAHECRKLK